MRRRMSAASLLEGAGGGRRSRWSVPLPSAPAADSPPRRWERHAAALERFRAAEGLYFSYVHADGTGYTWMDERGGPIVGFDRVVNANVLRFLALVGIASPEVQAYLMREAATGDFATGSPDYPNPLAFFYTVARAWRQAYLADRATLAAHLTPQILARETDQGFGGPLSTAMAVSALLDLDYDGPALERAHAALLRMVEPWGGWGYEDFVVHGFGSPAWSTALALVALDRSRAVQGVTEVGYSR